ncbi:MAG: hypothetical protein PHG91_06385 [Syntrophales bacterium]|nr:hypothetical protein [Syntrophales bacterium]
MRRKIGDNPEQAQEISDLKGNAKNMIRSLIPSAEAAGITVAAGFKPPGPSPEGR